MRKFVIMMIMAVALIALPTMAQQQEWKSTSTMQTSGSVYTPQVNAVGATAVGDMATTTDSYSPAKVGPRRSKDDPGEVEPFIDPGSPIGDAMVPLLLMAFAFGGAIYLRRRQRVE